MVLLGSCAGYTWTDTGRLAIGVVEEPPALVGVANMLAETILTVELGTSLQEGSAAVEMSVDMVPGLRDGGLEGRLLD